MPSFCTVNDGMARGKSTWARQTFPDAHIIDLLDESRYQSLAANPALLGLELRTLPANQVVVLNGVQRVPALLNEVHRAIEGAADRSCSGRWRYSQLSFSKASELVRDGARTPRC